MVVFYVQGPKSCLMKRSYSYLHFRLTNPGIQRNEYEDLLLWSVLHQILSDFQWKKRRLIRIEFSNYVKFWKRLMLNVWPDN